MSILNLRQIAIYEKAYIYIVRGGKPLSSTTETELNHYLKNITLQEQYIIYRWRYYNNYLKQFINPQLDTQFVISQLLNMTNHQFQVPLNLIPETYLNTVSIGYYAMLGWDIYKLPFYKQKYDPTTHLKKYEYAFLLAECRDEKIDSKMKVAAMKEQLGKITESDNQLLRQFRKLVHETYDYFPEYSVNSLTIHLGIIHKHAFPMPSTFVNKNEVVLAYYKYKGFDIQKKTKTFTNEQNYVLNQNISGIIVINAGPGTGKTTVANERAYRLKKEGVLLVSFTNSAIDENYKRLKTYPNMRTILQKKSYKKDRNVINVTTIDSLASHIVKTHKMGDNYDLNVVNAISLCPRLSKIIKRYKHIIVDEAQDINDSKGRFILEYFIHSGAKSICIFGDPRQRIHEKHGGWYTNLWTTSQYNGRQCTRIGFSYSYRFQNPLHLQIANHLSIQRPHLHYQLLQSKHVPFTNEERIKLYISKNNELDIDIGNIANYVLKTLHGELGVSFSDIAVIGASMNKNNATSAMAGKICSVFKDRGIPCYTKTDGSFIPDAVIFSTIHSIKGKEFDYVFIFGSDSFPETFKNIPYESAESLTYVMHTRARKRMYYISVKRNKYTPVRGLRIPTNPFISNHSAITNVPFKDPEPDLQTYKISELATEFSYLKFIESNDFKLNISKMEPLKTKVLFEGHILPDRPKEVNPRFWGIFCGLAVQLYMTNEYHELFHLCIRSQIMFVSDSSYDQRNRNGQIVGGRDIKTGKIILKSAMVNKIKSSEYIQLKKIIKKQINELILTDIIFLTKIYDYIVSGNTQSRYDIKNEDMLKYEEEIGYELAEMNLDPEIEQKMSNSGILCTLFQDIARVIQDEYGKSLFVERLVYNKYMNICGAIDSLHEVYTLEFKTTNRDFEYHEAVQAYLYSLCSNTEPFLINLQTGSVAHVSGITTIDRWRHITKSYGILKTHVDLVTNRYNQRIVKKRGDTSRNRKITPDMFVIDTEFATSFKSTAIFDIAVINVFDPYRSLVLTLNPGKRNIQFAMDWSGESEQLFNDSINIYQFKRLFKNLTQILGIKHVDLMYYSCKTDVNWCDDSINDLEKVKTDLSKIIKCDVKKLGYINSGSAPPLSDYYDVKCSPSDYQDHLQIHTALTDALLLYELLHMDYV